MLELLSTALVQERGLEIINQGNIVFITTTLFCLENIVLTLQEETARSETTLPVEDNN